jgi:hypothetical protein
MNKSFQLDVRSSSCVESAARFSMLAGALRKSKFSEEREI